jgi:hypothetical protein
MVMMVVVVIGGGARRENEPEAAVGNIFSRQRLHGRWIVEDVNGLRLEISSEMKIPQPPGNARGELGGRDRDAKNVLGFLLEDIKGVALDMENPTGLQRFVQIKAELASVFRGSPPATLGQNSTGRSQVYGFFAVAAGIQGVMNNR